MHEHTKSHPDDCLDFSSCLYADSDHFDRIDHFLPDIINFELADVD